GRGSAGGRSGAPGVTRSGADYVRALHDGRAVYVDGERVADVSTHPAFAAAVQSVARIYDLVHDSAGALTFPSPRSNLGRDSWNLSYLIPRSREDLAARRRLHQAVADASYGLLGRSPDCVAS